MGLGMKEIPNHPGLVFASTEACCSTAETTFFISPHFRFIDWQLSCTPQKDVVSCDQWLTVQMEISEKWSVLGPVLFNISVSDKDSGIEAL